MKVQIINKRVAIALILMLILLIIKINSMYSINMSQYYIDDINTGKYSVCYTGYINFYSPNKQHRASVDICKKNKNDEVSYIQGQLYIVNGKDTEEKFWKTFYLEKVASSEVKITNDEDYEKCVAEWIDNEHIKINGRIVDIYTGYDYRN